MLPPPGVVQISILPLSDASFDDDWARSLLNADERSRADRLRIPAKRRQFSRCRATLRTLLGRALEIDPADVQLTVGTRGRPMLGPSHKKADSRHEAIDFNVSHSDDWGVVALASGAAVGVDVENLYGTRDLPALARRYFSAAEAHAIATAPDEVRLARRFFQAWTAREALLKTTGHGLSGPLAEIELALDDACDARLLRVPDGLGDLAHWQLESFTPADGYFATVAVKTHAPTAWRLETRRFAGLG